MSEDIEFLKAKYHNAKDDERAAFRKLIDSKEYKNFMDYKELRERLEKKIESLHG